MQLETPIIGQTDTPYATNDMFHRAFTEPILVNPFDTYFAPKSFRGGVASWLESQVLVEYERGDFGGCPPACNCLGINLLSLGKPQSIPTTLIEATFTFKFKVLPEERIKELRGTSILQYGVGYQHAIYVGTVSLPLFNVYVNAEDNHLYIYFGGTLTAGGRRDIYPFGFWTVDLGDVSGFSEYVDFTIWLDLANKSFKKIFIGGKEVPFPPGYEEIKPQVLQSYMYKGVLIAESGGVHTNVKVMLDDVAVYGEYFTPPPPVPTKLWIGLGLGLLIGVGLIYFIRK